VVSKASAPAAAAAAERQRGNNDLSRLKSLHRRIPRSRCGEGQLVFIRPTALLPRRRRSAFVSYLILPFDPTSLSVSLFLVSFPRECGLQHAPLVVAPRAFARAHRAVTRTEKHDVSHHTAGCTYRFEPEASSLEP